MPWVDRQNDESIGTRIRAMRERRGWSIRYVASRAGGMSPSTLSRIERGLRTANNRYLLSDLAAALECSVVDITGQPYTAIDRGLERAHRGVAKLRVALVDAAPDEPAREINAMLSMNQLMELGELVDSRYDAFDAAALVELLARTIPQLHVYGLGGDRRATGLLVRSTYAAESVLRSLGYPADSWIAAERCREVACWFDDPVVMAVGDYKRATAAGGCVGYRRAATIAGRAIDALRPHLGEQDALTVLGMLHLNAAGSAMGQHRPETATEHLAEAEQIAERTGETTSWRMWFGPANVGVWRVGIEVDAGRPGAAIEIARKTTVTVLPPFRQAAFYTDLARGLAADRRTHDRAVLALLAAERSAPQHVRSSPLARETARDLRDSSRRAAGGTALRGLCERIGLAD